MVTTKRLDINKRISDLLHQFQCGGPYCKKDLSQKLKKYNLDQILSYLAANKQNMKLFWLAFNYDNDLCYF